MRCCVFRLHLSHHLNEEVKGKREIKTVRILFNFPVLTTRIFIFYGSYGSTYLCVMRKGFSICKLWRYLPRLFVSWLNSTSSSGSGRVRDGDSVKPSTCPAASKASVNIPTSSKHKQKNTTKYFQTHGISSHPCLQRESLNLPTNMSVSKFSDEYSTFLQSYGLGCKRKHLIYLKTPVGGIKGSCILSRRIFELVVCVLTPSLIHQWHKTR